MTMLKTFNLKGNKQSFADWISNLSPTETPFISMIPKEKVDQTKYQWQTDRLTSPGKMAAAATATGSDPDQDDVALPATHGQEGTKAEMENRFHTKVHFNFTQIFRKAVRVTDTTKKISLYGRSSELSYQMEKAGLEIKRDLEHTILNATETGRPGTITDHGICEGVQKLVAAAGVKDKDTDAEVHMVYTYAADAAPFTKAKVFELTLNLYLVGSRANKIMFHPMHMSVFSDWIGEANPKNTAAWKPQKPHLHRMFDGMDDKYNAFVKKIRDPLGQEFTLIPNRHMPTNQLFFFNENDWTQMVLREPEKILLAKMGSSEKYLIEMEVGLRHRNPFASGILEFTQAKPFLRDISVEPANTVITKNAATGALEDTETTVTVAVATATGAMGSATDVVTFTATTVNDDGASSDATVTPSAGGAASAGVASAKIKHKKGARVKVKASVADGEPLTQGIEATVDFAEPRD